MTIERRSPFHSSQERSTLSGPQPAQSRGGTDLANSERVNILLVDDEPKNLIVLESVLHDPRYRLVSVGSADEALFALIAEDFAVLVLDVNMPNMNGFELAQLIKSRRKSASIPIIFLTAYFSEDEHILEGYSTGAVDYLHKPINPTILRSKVAVLADLHLKTREVELVNKSLVAQVAEYQRVQEELQRLTRELENRVAERTEELTAANSVLTDAVSELRRAEESLKNADRQKDEFLATLGHELRNPLAPIRNAVQLLQLKASDPAELSWAIDVIDRQSKQMNRLVDDLLDMSRVTTGKLSLRREPVELARIVQAAVETSQPLIAECGHQLTVALPPEPVVLSADLTRLSQAISNLLNNAAKYMERGGVISVISECRDSEVLLTVKDAGYGIPAEVLPYVFEMFTQGDRHLKRSQGGLGIGLTLVKRMVELHEGSIEARSSGIDQGSEFTIRLPLLVASEIGPNVDPVIRPANCTAPLRVLVADDNQDNANSLRLLLQTMSHDVRVAHDGLEAIQCAEDFRPDVILMDLGMPNLDGCGACRRIREEDWGTEIVMIAQTGWGQEEDRRRTNEAGFDHHLVKPVDQLALISLLAEVEKDRSSAKNATTQR